MKELGKVKQTEQEENQKSVKTEGREVFKREEVEKVKRYKN